MAGWLEIERQDLSRGVRAAVATVVPFVLAWTLHRPELSWLALGGWLGSLADPGGARSRHAVLSGAFGVCGGILVVLGGLAEPHVVAAAALLALVACLGALLRATGAIGSTFGTLLTVATAIATSAGTQNPLHAGALFALGTAWSTFLSSLVWPIWTHLPLRHALSKVFAALAALATHPTRTSLRRTQRPIRDALENARDVSLSLRARRFGESVVGSNLRALLGIAETSFFGLIAVTETARETHDPVLIETLHELGACYGKIAEQLARPGLQSSTEPVVDTPRLPDGSPLVERLQLWASLALRVARAPGHHWTDTSTIAPAGDETKARLAEAGRALRGSLSTRSPYFRHGIRVACTAVVAMAIGRQVSPQHVSWVTVTALAILQPYPGATWTRALERAVGTVFGCLVTAAVMAIVHAPWALALVMFPLSVAAVYTKPRSYRLFTFFLTPVFVLFLDAGQGDLWTVTLRALDSGIGASIALAATFLLFPSWEGRRIDAALEDVTRKLANYTETSLVALASDRSPGIAATLAAARREVGLALGEAELSLERLLSEPRRHKTGAHRAMQWVTCSRRLTASLTTLDMQRIASSPVASSEDLEPLRVWLLAILGHAEPQPTMPAIPEIADRESLSRVVRQGQLLASIDRAGAAH